MTRARKRARIRNLRRKADRLNGMFDLHDYVDNLGREHWQREAKDCQQEADRLELSLRRRRKARMEGRHG